MIDNFNSSSTVFVSLARWGATVTTDGVITDVTNLAHLNGGFAYLSNGYYYEERSASDRIEVIGTASNLLPFPSSNVKKFM